MVNCGQPHDCSLNVTRQCAARGGASLPVPTARGASECLRMQPSIHRCISNYMNTQIFLEKSSNLNGGGGL